MQPIEVNHIWKYRKGARMGQKRLAHLLNHANHSQVSSWERGASVPTVQNLFKLAHILQIPAETLYADLYRRCAKEVDKREESLPHKKSKIEHTPLFA